MAGCVDTVASMYHFLRAPVRFAGAIWYLLLGGLGVTMVYQCIIKDAALYNLWDQIHYMSEAALLMALSLFGGYFELKESLLYDRIMTWWQCSLNHVLQSVMFIIIGGFLMGNEWAAHGVAVAAWLIGTVGWVLSGLHIVLLILSPTYAPLVTKKGETGPLLGGPTVPDYEAIAQKGKNPFEDSKDKKASPGPAFSTANSFDTATTNPFDPAPTNPFDPYPNP